jgi:hypothetical protein
MRLAPEIQVGVKLVYYEDPSGNNVKENDCVYPENQSKLSNALS